MSVHALARSGSHSFSKPVIDSLTLLTGLGVAGDCHAGTTVQHRSRLHIQPPPTNLRQVHLLSKELLDEAGVEPGQLGENVTTVGIDMLALGRGTRLHFVAHEGNDALSPGSTSGSGGDGVERGQIGSSKHAVVVLQGLRNPCPQIDKFRAGLKEHFLVRDEERKILARRAGVMGTVEVGGVVVKGMRIVVECPAKFEPLEPV